MSKSKQKYDDEIKSELRNKYIPKPFEDSELTFEEDFKLDENTQLMKCIKRYGLEPSTIDKKGKELAKLREIAMRESFHMDITKGQEIFIDNIKSRAHLPKINGSKMKTPQDLPLSERIQEENTPKIQITPNLDNFGFEEINDEISQISSSKINEKEDLDLEEKEKLELEPEPQNDFNIKELSSSTFPKPRPKNFLRTSILKYNFAIFSRYLVLSLI